MTDLRVMLIIIYATMTAVSLFIAGESFLLWRAFRETANEKRKRLIWAQGIMFSAKTFMLAMLTLTSGVRPIVDPDRALVLIVVTRLLFLATMMFYAWRLHQRLAE